MCYDNTIFCLEKIFISTFPFSYMSNFYYKNEIIFDASFSGIYFFSNYTLLLDLALFYLKYFYAFFLIFSTCFTSTNFVNIWQVALRGNIMDLFRSAKLFKILFLKKISLKSHSSRYYSSFAEF